jgi:hypothetical protein
LNSSSFSDASILRGGILHIIPIMERARRPSLTSNARVTLADIDRHIVDHKLRINKKEEKGESFVLCGEVAGLSS